MQKVDDYFTEIIDITLYKYNSIDLKLWGILQRDSEVKKSNDETVIVSKKRMLQYLELGLRKMSIDSTQLVVLIYTKRLHQSTLFGRSLRLCQT